MKEKEKEKEKKRERERGREREKEEKIMQWPKSKVYFGSPQTKKNECELYNKAILRYSAFTHTT